MFMKQLNTQEKYGIFKMTPEILTTQEAAELLRFKPDKICQMANAGEIPGTKIGDDWRFVREDVIRCLSAKALSEQNIRKLTKTDVSTTQKGKPGRRGKNIIGPGGLLER